MLMGFRNYIFLLTALCFFSPIREIYASSSSREMFPSYIRDGDLIRPSPLALIKSQRLSAGGYGTVFSITLTSGTKRVIKYMTLSFGLRQQVTDAWLIGTLAPILRSPKMYGCFDGTPQERGAEKTLGMVLEEFDSDLESLRRDVEGNPTLSTQHIQYIGHQIFTGLAKLHSARIVHGDVKPGNILLNNNCRIALTDFGLAVPLPEGGPTSRKAHISTNQYTFSYRPPELIDARHREGKKLRFDTSSDIYAAGISVAELMLRESLFSAQTSDKRISQLRLIKEQEILWAVLHAEKCPPLLDDADPIHKKCVKLRQILEKFPEGVSFFRELLHHNRELRITAEEAAKSPFWGKYTTPPEESLSITTERAKEINRQLTSLRSDKKYFNNQASVTGEEIDETIRTCAEHFPIRIR